MLGIVNGVVGGGVGGGRFDGCCICTSDLRTFLQWFREVDANGAWYCRRADMIWSVQGLGVRAAEREREAWRARAKRLDIQQIVTMFAGAVSVLIWCTPLPDLPPVALEGAGAKCA